MRTLTVGIGLIIFSVLESAAPAAVVFRSDFEGTVAVIAPSICTGCKFAGNIVGASAGYSWDTDFPGTRATNMLNLILGEQGDGCTSDPDCCCDQLTFSDWMTVEVVSTTGPDGLPTRALFNRINSKWHNGPPDYTTARFSTLWGGTPLMNDNTQQYWIKWPQEVATSLSSGDHWMSMFEQNTGVSPYMVQYVKRIATKYGGALFWQWRRAGGAVLENSTVEVPIDRWFKVSMYFKAGAVNGRYKLDILDQGQVINVYDFTGDTGPGSVDSSNFIKQYSDAAPLSVYYDDYAIFDGEEPLLALSPADGGVVLDSALGADAPAILDTTAARDKGAPDACPCDAATSATSDAPKPAADSDVARPLEGQGGCSGCTVDGGGAGPESWSTVFLLALALRRRRA